MSMKLLTYGYTVPGKYLKGIPNKNDKDNNSNNDNNDNNNMKSLSNTQEAQTYQSTKQTIHNWKVDFHHHHHHLLPLQYLEIHFLVTWEINYNRHSLN